MPLVRSCELVVAMAEMVPVLSRPPVLLAGLELKPEQAFTAALRQVV